MTKIVIYTKLDCPYCVRAKEAFKARNLAFEEVRIDLDPEKLGEMLRLSEGRRTVPQIFINDKGIGGFDDLAKLITAGKLNELL